jgi:uncharacterized protein (DUF4415 family)
MKRPSMRPEMRPPIRPEMRPLTNKAGEVRELTEEDMRLFKPIAEVDPGMVEAIKEFGRKVGRPKAIAPKVHVGFRLAADVVASIKASGRGYNARVEQVLREAGFGAEEGREASRKKAAAKKIGAEKRRRAERLAAAKLAA